MSLNPITSWLSQSDPLFVVGGGNGINVPVLNIEALNVSTINAKPLYPLQNTFSMLSKTVSGSGVVATNISSLATYSAGTIGLVNLPAGFYNIQTELNATNNAGSFNLAPITPSVRFSTGQLLAYGTTVPSALSTIELGESICGFTGLLDCPVDNAPLVFEARAPAIVGQSILSAGGGMVFRYNKLDSV